MQSEGRGGIRGLAGGAAMALVPLISQANEPVRLSPIMVEDLGISYQAESAESALRSDVPLKDWPQAVQVLNTEVLRDQGVYRFDDIYRNVTGANQFSYNQDFQIRGFRVQRDQVTFDGLRANPYDGFINPIMINVDRVEVQKGPGALLSGSSGPGGNVNLVSKKPLAITRREVSATVAEYDRYRLTGDMTGPLNESGTLLYRIVAGGEDSGSFRNNVEERNLQLAPSLTWLAAERTAVTAQAEVFRVENTGRRDRGIPAPGGDTSLVPIRFSAAEPGDRQDNDGFAGTLTLDHDFNDRWRARLRGRYSESDYIDRYHEPRQVAEDGRTMLRQWRDLNYNNQEWNLLGELKGDLRVAGMRHRVDLGLDAGRRLRRDRLAFVDSITYDPEADNFIPPIDIFDPVYGQTDPDTYDYDLASRSFDIRSRALYLRDYVELDSRWSVLGGLRYERYEETGTQNQGQDNALTGQAGVVYQLHPRHSLYASYSEGFEPQVGFGEEDGGPFDPQESSQWEAGIKSEWLDGRLSTTLAAYRITRENDLVSDPQDSARRLQIGEFRSEGLELDVIGQITPAWRVTAGYAYNDARVTRDSNPDNVGRRAENAPRHSAHLWSRYDLTRLDLGVAGGITYADRRETFADTVTLPSHTLLDLALYYTGIEGLELALNVSNLTNERHFVGGYTERIIFPGAPRTVSATARYRF